MRTTLAVLLALSAAVPAHADLRASQRRAAIDNLLDNLKSAPNEESAEALETQLRKLWLEAGSPAATLLVSRGVRLLQNDAGPDALASLDNALVLDPDYAEAYSRRAVARAMVGDYDGALRDIQQALVREPRHFGALAALSRIAEQRGDQKGALAAWRKVLEIDPKIADGEKRLRELNRKVNGERL